MFLGISAEIYTIYQEGDGLAIIRGISTLMRASQKIQSSIRLKVMNNNNNIHYINKYLLIYYAPNTRQVLHHGEQSPCLHETYILMEEKIIHK